MPPVEIDLSGLAQLIVNALMDGMRQTFSPLPSDFISYVLMSIQGIFNAQNGNNVLTHIPTEWTSGNSEVVTLWRALLAAQAVVAAIVLAIHGYLIMSGKADLFNVLFRVGFFYFIAATLLVWAGMIFNAVNAMSDWVGTTPLTVGDSRRSADILLGALVIIGAVFAILAWVKGAVGVLFLAVLLVAGPFILIVSSLPIFSGLGQWWAEEFTTWTLRPFMVALVLRLGLGIGASVGGEAIAVLFAIVSFWLAWTMDTRIKKFSVGGWGSLSQLQMLKRGAAAAAPAFGAVAPVAVPAAAAAGG